MSPILEDQAGLSPRTPSKRCRTSKKPEQNSSDSALTQKLSTIKEKHTAPNSALRQVHTVTGHMKHWRGIRALTSDGLDHLQGQTLLLNHRKTPRPGLEQTANRREEHHGGEELRAGDRGNQDLARNSWFRGTKPHDYGNRLQVYRQRREREERWGEQQSN
uniref:Uncharacterized protein n=1 Tax=Oryza meridionalis TaxID=40149 RepID=A0A0E0EL57_9ORYZ